MEKIIEFRNCNLCTQEFHIYEKDIFMLEQLSPTISWKKYTLPLPTFCAHCRRKNRLAWRNESKLFRRKCDLTWKTILSFCDENVKHPVYEREAWFSHEWSAFDYGQEFDFSRPFFEQLEELKNKVPIYSRSILRAENSEFSNNANDVKNCYLCFNGGEAEDCYYCTMFHEVKDCIDCYNMNQSSACYEDIDCFNCHEVFFSQNSKDCYKSSFLKNCIGCKNCFWCKNRINGEYYFFNVQYSPKQYEQKVAEIQKMYSFEEIQKQVDIFFKNLPEKYITGVLNENVIGEYINASKDVFMSFEIIDSENIRYSTSLKDNSKNCLDVDGFGWSLENCYESCIIGHYSGRVFFSFDCWDKVSNLLYCISCIQSTSDCFWCVWLTKQKYCILNKQYTKEQYEALLPKIIEHLQKTGEWGQFLPKKLSSNGYNQSVCQEYYPLTQEEALQQGFLWSHYEAPFPKVDKSIPAQKLPNDIWSIPDDILNWAIECEISKRPFKIIEQELNFLRVHHLPIPKRHPEERHLKRIRKRNIGHTIYSCKCQKCGKDIQTGFAPETKSIVYCEECYNKEIL